MKPTVVGETFTLTAYHAGDLPKDVQEKIAEENRHFFVEDEWWYEAKEDYYKTEILKKVGLGCEKIFFSLFGQGQHAYLHKPYIDDMRVLLKHLGYDLRKRLPRAIMENEADVEISEHSRSSFGLNSVSIYLYRGDYPNCDDDIKEMEGAIKELIEGIMRKYREDLEKEYEYATSDDYIIEGMDANDKLFYETGDEIPWNIVDALRKEARE